MKTNLTNLRVLVLTLVLALTGRLGYSQGTCPVGGLPFNCYMSDVTVTGPNTFRFSVYMQATGAEIPLRTFQGGLKVNGAFNTGTLSMSYVSRIFGGGGAFSWDNVNKIIRIAVNTGVSCNEPVYQYPIGTTPVKIMEIQAVSSQPLACQPTNLSFNFATTGGQFPTAITQWVVGSCSVVAQNITTSGCGTYSVQDQTAAAFNPSFSGLAPSYSTSDGTVNLLGSPAGGTFSGPGVVGSSFEPSTAGAGTHTIVYTTVPYGAVAGCTRTSSQTTTVSGGCSVTSVMTATDAACFGGLGSVTITLTGATAPVSYSLDGAPAVSSGTSITFPGVSVGPHSITYTDATLCTGTDNATVGQPASNLLASCSVTANVSCNGGTDGAASVSASGGTPPYSGTGSFTGLAAGTYTYTVTDFNGCTTTCQATITEPAVLVASCSVVSHVSCNGGSDGSASVSASGGTAPYTGTGSFTGLAAGSYTYNVSDANGCTASCSVTITEPAALAATATATDAACTTCATGTVTIGTISGGTAPYNVSPASPMTGLLPGTYCFNVTDNNGCTTTACATVGVGGCSLVANCSHISDVTCNGANNGSASVTTTGGVGPYSYLWDNGETTATAVALSGGSHSVTVTDLTTSCVAGCSVTIAEPAVLSASCSVASDVSCNGGSDGSASVSASGGTAPYTGTGSFTGLAAGSYTYNVSDANGCTASCSVTITEPAVLVATCSVVSNVTCNGGFDGSASVSASGGTAPYTPTGTFSGLAAGAYTFTVTDANGCTASCSVTITEPAALVATCSVVSNVSCNGGSDGAASVSASGGTAPYTGTGSFTGLAAGTYSYTVTDASGCTASCSVTITEPAVLVATCSVTANVSCNGGSDGAASVSASGGTAPYTGTGSFTGLAAGSYTYNVSDANGCTASCSVTITEPAVLVASCSVVSNVSCNGGSDGSASVSASGGTAPYTGTGSFTGLAAGSYTYNVSDANGCTASCSVTITEPAVLVASCSVQSNVTCNGGTDGSASVSASGGTAPYGGTGSFTGLAAGSYTYTVTDANGCTASCSVTITEPAALVATCSVVSNVSCNGGTDGSASVSASGGVAPYTGTGSFTGLAAGTYTYSVSDASGCTASCSVTITEPAVLVATCSVTANVSCNGGSDGAASVSASGGTAPYTGTGSFTGLAAGSYTYNVSDANGCTASCSVTITEPAVLVATCSVVSNVSCNGGSDGSASVSASGGTAPYTGTGSFTGLAAGSYTYNVSDANGCTASCSVTITEPAVLVASCSVQSNVTCNGGTDGSASVSASGGTAPYGGTGSFTGLAAGSYTYTVTDANGCTASCSVTITEPAALVATCSVVSNVTCNGGTDGSASVSASGGVAPYTGTGSFTGLAAGTYTYSVSDASGCTASCSVTITEPAVLVASATSTPSSCPTCADGTVSVAGVSGGTAPYNYTNLTGLLPGPYCITVTDANGCTAQACATVGSTACSVVASCSVVSNVSCNGGSDGSASVSASGGTAPYTGTGTFTGLAAGTYTYVVTDANSCSASCSVTITEPAVLVATCSVQSNVACFGGSDGSASVSASGGTAPYSGTGSFTGLAAGTYTYTVTDANGCTASCSVTITEPAAALSASSSAGTILCFGGTASVTISATGGTAPYSGTGTFSQSAGTVVYTVSDANGCTTTTSVTLSEPTKVEGTTSSVAANCGFNDGSATVVATGGTPGYTYVWNPGGQTTATATNLAGGTYTVTITDANGCTGSATEIVGGVGSGPANAGPVSGPAGACRNTTGIVYSIAPVAGASSYVWSLPAGVSGSSTTNSITVAFGGAAYVGGFICVTPTNACGAGLAACINVPVIAVKPGLPSLISGTFPSCGPATYTYSVSPIANATNYVWTVGGAGVSITSGQGTNSVQVFVPAGMGQGTISVYGQNCVGNGSARSTYLTGVPTHSNALVGPGFVCAGTLGVAYSMGPVNGASSYVWSITGNASIASSSGPSCTVDFLAGWTTGVLSVTTTNSCGSFTRTYTIRSTPAQPGSIAGPASNLCGQSGVTYSIAAVAGATGYTWTVPAGVTPTTPLTGLSITVDFTAGFTNTGNICVTASNTCGSGTARCYAVTARPAAGGVITGPSPVCKTSTQIYSISPVSGALSYTWSVTGGASIIPGGTSATVNFNTALSTSATVKVNANNACGAGQPAQKIVAVNLGCRTAQDVLSAEPALSAYPNPTSGMITVNFTADVKAKYTVKVVDLLGNVVMNDVVSAVEGVNMKDLDLSKAAKGMYLLTLENEGGNVQTLRIVVE
ncbi:MAG: T9SS type A sorting domain-containing protein [Bacteroidetes bacterium]|nr:T9SS type A sorting domain-containing protein [Bacteroidota bacterium]